MKFKNMILTLGLSTVMLLSNSQTVFATDLNYVFPDEIITRSGATGTHHKVEVVGQPKISPMEFVSYHPNTTQWAKSSQYTTSRAFTIFGQVEYGDGPWSAGLGGSVTTEVGTQIPADPNRFSRLAVYADFKITTYRVRTYENGSGRLVNDILTKLKSPTATYVVVKYK